MDGESAGEDEACALIREAIVSHPLRLISTIQNSDLLRIRGHILDTVAEVVQDATLLGMQSLQDATTWDDVFGNPLFETARKFHFNALHLARRVHYSSVDMDSDVPPDFLMCFLMDDRVGAAIETAHRESLACLKDQSLDPIAHLDYARENLGLSCLNSVTLAVGHSYFSTTSGRFGFAMQELQPGDKVATFYGGEPLYILRYHNSTSTSKPNYSTDHAEFRGTAYIPRLIKPHQWDAARLGPDEIFVIT